MAWFRWLYEHVLVWLDWAHELVDPIKRRIRRLVAHLPRRSKPDARCGCCGASAAACARRARGRRTRPALRCKCSDVRREQPKRHEGEPEHAEPAGQVAQHHHAGDDGRRRQHDADLERRRGELVVMVLGELFDRDGAALRWRAATARRCLRPCRRPLRARSGSAPRSWSIRRSAWRSPPSAPGRSRRRDRVLRLFGWRRCVEVRRMFLAWKKFHRFDASIWELSAAVCALLPNVSENARNSASTEISSATFLLRSLLPSWPCRRMLVRARILCSTSCCTACTP